MELKNTIYTKEEGIATIVINRPDKANAVNRDTRRELRSILEDIKADSSIRVLIVTGAGDKFFMSGSDLTDLKELSPLDMYNFMTTIGQQLYTDFESLDIPVIAMVNGLAYGLGTEFALACDIRIASENARFGQPEISLGFIPGGGGTQRLAKLVGIGRAKELIYTGGTIDAKEAERIGLVNKVVPKDKLEETVKELAQKIASKSPVAIKIAKKAMNKGTQAGLDVGLALEVLAECLCFTTEDHKEGITAFLEKRAPKFTGK